MTEPPTETENLVLVIPDALRHDYWPELPGTTVDTIAAGPFTPVCLPSLVSGRTRREHGRQWFLDDPIDFPVVYDLETEGYDVAYWDSPNDHIRALTRAPELKPLVDMEPPFVWVARLLWTHTPYGMQWDEDESDVAHYPRPGVPRGYPNMDGGDTGRDYIELMRDGEVDFVSDYEDGVVKTVERIQEWKGVLQDRGLYDDTTFIVEADHGEAWGGPLGIDDCSHAMHSQEVCNKVMSIRTTVLDRDLDIRGPLNQQKTLALWDDSWEGGRDDLEMVDRDSGSPASDEAMQRLEDLGYL